MKKRVMQETLSERQKQIDAQNALARQNIDRAFSIDEISRANKEYVDLTFRAMTSDEDLSKFIEKAHKNYQKTLKKYGFSEEDFVGKPVCPLCSDTGFVDGKICSCIWDSFVENLKKECQIDERAKFSFDDCDLSKIKDEQQRRLTGQLYD